MWNTCSKLAAKTRSLTLAQRAFWVAWSAYRAGDHSQMDVVRAARRELEDVYTSVNRTIYEHWFARALGTVEVKRNYKEIEEYREQFVSEVPGLLQVLKEGGKIFSTDGGFVWRYAAGRMQLNGHDTWVSGVIIGTLIGDVLQLQAFGESNMAVLSTEGFLYIYKRVSLPKRELQFLTKFGQDERAFQVLPDETVITLSHNRSVRRWNRLSDGSYDVAAPMSIEHRLGTCLSALPDGRIVTGGLDGFLRVWTPDGDGYRTQALSCNDLFVNAIHAAPDGRLFGMGNTSIFVFEPDGDGFLLRQTLKTSSKIANMQVLPDGRMVVAFTEGSVTIYAPDARGTFRGDESFVVAEGIRDIQVTSDGQVYITSPEEQSIIVFDGDRV